MSRRVVITGLGTVNPLGNNVKDFWKNIQNSENGIDKVTKIDTSIFPTHIGAEVKNLDHSGLIDKKDARRMDPFTIYSILSCIEALQDAGLKIGDGGINPERIGAILGNGIGGIETLATNIINLNQKGYKGVHPLFMPKMLSNLGPGNMSIQLNLQGPCFTVATACASGTDALGNAFMYIKNGMADAMLAGGSEAPFDPIAFAGFCVLQALCTKFNDTPDKASRPFDKDRDGFVMGEGAGMLVLEELEYAKKRGAKIYAEVAGYGATCDANHITAPHPEGRGAIKAMQIAVESAGLRLDEIDYINAHGTSTPVNDPVETKAIKVAFGEHADRKSVV